MSEALKYCELIRNQLRVESYGLLGMNGGDAAPGKSMAEREKIA